MPAGAGRSQHNTPVRQPNSEITCQALRRAKPSAASMAVLDRRSRDPGDAVVHVSEFVMSNPSYGLKNV